MGAGCEAALPPFVDAVHKKKYRISWVRNRKRKSWSGLLVSANDCACVGGEQVAPDPTVVFAECQGAGGLLL